MLRLLPWSKALSGCSGGAINSIRSTTPPWIAFSSSNSSSSAEAAASATIQADSEAERKIADKLAKAFQATSITVMDTSGGCGAMYSIEVVANDFKGKNIVAQHQAVHRVLKEDIAQWHGLNLSTKVP